MNLLSSAEGLAILTIFGIAMLALVWFKTHDEKHAEGFLVADRNIPMWHAALSIAVSWIWAPAIFICSMQAYTKGLPGIFWFTFPNVLCFFIFTPVAIRLRKLMPYGFTLPEFIAQRFAGEVRTHLIFLIVFLGYQLGAIVINCLAGGALLHAVSGLDFSVAVVGMAVIALSYSLFSGLKASVFTDVIQMLMVLIIAYTLVPWAVIEAGGIKSVFAGLAGIDHNHGNIFDLKVAFYMGIPMTLGLIAGPLSDQMFFQRAMAVRPQDIAKTFIWGGILFATVPISLALLGFVAVGLSTSGAITVTDPQIVGALVIGELLPITALYAFCFMAFAGLCSTLDSAFCAISSLGSIDIYKRYFNPAASDRQILLGSRWFMLVFAAVGVGGALLQPKLLWVFLIYGTMASSAMVPTVLSIFWKQISGRTAFWAVLLSLLLGTPLSIYANVVEDADLIVLSAILSVAVGLIVCLLPLIGGRIKRQVDC